MKYYQNEIDHIKQIIRNHHKIISIDGRCGSGKSTFSVELADALDAEILHMDDFFLQPYQRTKERYATPGANVDYERVYEILKEIKQGNPVAYQRFDCSIMELGETLHLSGNKTVVVEGSYSLTNALQDLYDFKIFLTINPIEQIDRIVKRNGKEKAEQFKERWIPLEELYFQHCHVEDICDIKIDTSKKENEDVRIIFRENG